jgi:tetratricopeptide (TPR) repeat protein
MVENYFALAYDSLGQFLLILGALAAAGLMRWASQYYTRVCQKHGTALAACGLTGQLVAERLLAKCGLGAVAVVRSSWRNAYHPWKRQIQLTPMIFEGPSLLALTTAAHEVGHAQQFAAQILVCRLRRYLLPICWLLIGLVVLLPVLQVAEVVLFPIANLGEILLILGFLTVLAQVPIHLPLEYDASRRARKLVQDEKLIDPGEQHSFDQMLKAAWCTHAAHQAQGFVCLLAAAAVLFWMPSFMGSFDREAEDSRPTETASREEPPKAAPIDPPLPLPTGPESIDELPAIDAYFSLYAGFLGLVPCVLLYFVFAKFTSGARYMKPPAQKAIERNNAGLALTEKGAFQAAIREFDQALRLDPALAAAYYNRGQTYFRLGKLDEALADFEANLRLAPRYAYGVAARGEVWAQRGDFERALLEYGAALRLAPENPSLLARRGFARFRRNDFDGALADFESALRFNPKESLAHRGRGMVCMARSELDKALAELDQAIALGDRDPTIYVLRGQVWLGKNDLERAEAEFTEALKKDPKQADAFRDRGLAWLLAKQFRRAITDLDAATQLNPTDAVSWNNRGAAFVRTGNYARAAADLRESIRLAPSLPNPYKHLGWLQATCPQAEFRNGPEAVANATRALELDGWKTREWLSALAAAQAEAGNFEEAVRWQTKWLEESLAPLREEALRRLALYQARQPFRDQPESQIWPA